MSDATQTRHVTDLDCLRTLTVDQAKLLNLLSELPAHTKLIANDDEETECMDLEAMQLAEIYTAENELYVSLTSIGAHVAMFIKPERGSSVLVQYEVIPNAQPEPDRGYCDICDGPTNVGEALCQRCETGGAI